MREFFFWGELCGSSRALLGMDSRGRLSPHGLEILRSAQDDRSRFARARSARSFGEAVVFFQGFA